jgi:hypothetical protein
MEFYNNAKLFDRNTETPNHDAFLSNKIIPLKFINVAINTLPIDPIKENYTRQVATCYSLVKPTPVVNPQLVHFSSDALNLLDIDINYPNFLYYFCGNMLLQVS